MYAPKMRKQNLKDECFNFIYFKGMKRKKVASYDHQIFENFIKIKNMGWAFIMNFNLKK